MTSELPTRKPVDPACFRGETSFWPWSDHTPQPVQRELTEEERDSIRSILSGETPEEWEARKRRESEEKQD